MMGAMVTTPVTTPFHSQTSVRVQIYRKVTSQIPPSALDRVQNVRAREFIRGCLSPDQHQRPSAMDLLNLPFLKDKNEEEVHIVCASELYVLSHLITFLVL